MKNYGAIGAEIEALLESLPRQAERALDGAVPVSRLTSEFIGPAAWACADCGRSIMLPGLCRRCGAADVERAARHEMAGALESIPAAYALSSQPQQLRVVCHLAPADDPWFVAGEIAAELSIGDAAFVLVTGPESGAGKSSFGCAVLRRAVDAAFDALLAWRPPPSRDRLAPMPVEPKIVSFGRGARVVAEADLLGDAALGPNAPPGVYALAERVPLLILDGMAAGRVQTVHATTRLLERRWAMRRSTVVTTPLSPDDIGRYYDGGLRRRLSDDRASRVVRVL